ncbi:hypothetical protein [endosymbiont GvMRE of Glomus versiforme]|uniref:hypothetical protein n=1 Tax=endosymbiont GvMRE of Glomus versiforme TaxID=2039283 RepID=UPI000ECAE485|nr:hypothetical protein [endosymbiont GvMRE of Glomus versiforme]RHZ35619.1 hypothetical protein GvMRE_IIg397 [endosymbiont GvMRE of Glomus versiforme]
MVKIETRLNGEPYIYNSWLQIKTEEVWQFESRTKDGKWPGHGVYSEAEWVILVAKKNPCFKDIKVEYKYYTGKFQEIKHDYIYEIEFEDNPNQEQKKEDERKENLLMSKKRLFWKEHNIKMTKKGSKDDNKEGKNSEKPTNWTPWLIGGRIILVLVLGIVAYYLWGKNKKK